jgi:putative flippase GtrA
MFRLKKSQRRELKRITAYMVSGGAQFWSGYAAFAVLDLVLGVAFWPARVLSYTFGVIVNFYLQRFWVFKAKRISKKQINVSAEKYYALMFTNFLIDMVIVGVLYEVFGVSAYIGQFVSAGFFTVWNYVLFKMWVFAKQRRSSPSVQKKSTNKTAASRRRR